MVLSILWPPHTNHEVIFSSSAHWSPPWEPSKKENSGQVERKVLTEEHSSHATTPLWQQMDYIRLFQTKAEIEILKSEMNLACSSTVLVWSQLSHQSCFALGLSFPINLKKCKHARAVTGCYALYWFVDSKMLMAVPSLVLWWTIAWCKKWVTIWTPTLKKISPFILRAVSIRSCFHCSS